MSGGGAEPDLVAAARALASEAHEGQSRKATGMPYVEHVGEVAALLDGAGFDPEVVAAGLLHDVIEHTEVEEDEIRGRFGQRVAAIVSAMTDREEIEDWTERKDEHRRRVERAGRDACAVYAADKLCGIGETRRGFAREGPAVESRLGNPLDLRLDVWRRDLAMLEGVDPPLPFRDEMRAGIDALGAEAATAPRS